MTRIYKLTNRSWERANDLFYQRYGEVAHQDVLENLVKTLDEKNEEAMFYRIENDGSVKYLSLEDVRNSMEFNMEIKG